MKKNKILKIFIAIVLLISIETSVIAATTGIVNTDTARVRKKPSTSKDSKIITLVSIGDKITITGEENNWYKVKVDGMVGYIRKDLLTVDEKTTEIKQEPNEQKPSENKPTTENPTQSEKTEEVPGETTGQDTPVENEIPTNGEAVNEGTTGETSSDGKEVENGDKKISTIKVSEGVSVGTKINLTNNTKIKILPSANSSNIAELQVNTEVTIVEVINRWCRIEAGENIGWVRIDQ